MLVSWNWLKDYVQLDMDSAEVENRLAMSGLNHESTEKVGDDLAIDLEVTSNRPDCLGHIGVAREIAVQWNRELKIPSLSPTTSGESVDGITKVAVACPELCYRYTARVIRGVKIGPSPDWLTKRLKTIGIATINNVVNITNYVLMENGQPLHAFDLKKLAGPEIIVRDAAKDEEFVAIDHKTYKLEAGMCVIGDAKSAVALGGVMGGADTEVSESTSDVLIESAEFAPLAIRSTARKLNLYSPSSYRFERRVDPEGINWASLRCCEMILDIAGGKLAEGVIDVGGDVAARQPVVLRLAQLKRILGIDISAHEVRRILAALGNQEQTADDKRIEVIPPTWRRDLTREIDLVEEIARIHGYEEIPEDVGVPMAPSHRQDSDRVLEKIRHLLTSAGFDEAMTASVVLDKWSESFSPWTDAAPITASTPMLKGADRLRRSLVPSLLEARRVNESLANATIELFETAHVYLPESGGLPREQRTLAITSGGEFGQLKGVIEALVSTVNANVRLEIENTNQPLFDGENSCCLKIDGKQFGFMGQLSQNATKEFSLRSQATVAELSIDVLNEVADLIPQYRQQSLFPSISRELNLIVDESLRWDRLAETVRNSAGDCLEDLTYQETYRDREKDGADKKRMLFSTTLRSSERTMTNEEADQIRDQVVQACKKAHGAVLLG